MQWETRVVRRTRIRARSKERQRTQQSRRSNGINKRKRDRSEPFSARGTHAPRAHRPVAMPRKRTKEEVAHETATQVAEGIGEALGRIVNRLESLDAEREHAYEWLLAIQERLNAQVARFGRGIGRTTRGASPARTSVPRQPSKKTREISAKSRSVETKAKQHRKKVRIKCGICGTPGHNARGHARWKRRRASE